MKAKLIRVLMLVTLALTALVVLSPQPALAATCTWTGATSTDWATASNWTGCGGLVPGGSDTALIGPVANNPVVTATTAVGTITIQNGGVLTYNGAGGVTFSITTFNIQDGGKYIHNRAAPTPLNTATGRSFSSNSTVEIQDFSAPSATVPTFGNLIINSSSIVQMSGYLGAVNGTLTKENTGEFRLATTQVVNLTIGGNLDIQGGTITIQSGTTSNTASVSVAGSVSIGSATLQRGTGAFGLWTLGVGGNWTNNGTFTAGTSTVTFNGTATPSLLQTFSGNTTFNNLTINSGAIVETGTSLMTVGGSYTNNGQVRHSPTTAVTGCDTGSVSEKDATNNNTITLSNCAGGSSFTGATIKSAAGYGFPNVDIGSSLKYDTCPASSNLVYRYWGIAPNGSGAGRQATVDFIFRTAEQNGNTGNLNVYKCVSGAWQQVAGGLSQTDIGSGYQRVTASNLTLGSAYALGGSAPSAATLSSFTARADAPEPMPLIGLGALMVIGLGAGAWWTRRKFGGR